MLRRRMSRSWNSVFVSAVLAAGLSLAAAGPMLAQDDEAVSIVSLYRVAPGQHVAFLEWMAGNEAAAAQAGVPASQWYAHINGDAWDYLVIAPETTDEQDAAVEAALQAQGRPTGPAGGIEFRRFMAWHTDTFVAGPMTAAELLTMVGGE
ncbi:MAG TPA: hypothetical protein VJP59_01835 [Gemmatimonadota bacterium]|nr:hypothetical protein [Gemmatimonadota bacterium]